MAFAHINIENMIAFGEISLSTYILYTVLNIIEFKHYDKISFDEEGLDRIDTQEYARYFSELLTENQQFKATVVNGLSESVCLVCSLHAYYNKLEWKNSNSIQIKKQRRSESCTECCSRYCFCDN